MKKKNGKAIPVIIPTQAQFVCYVKKETTIHTKWVVVTFFRFNFCISCMKKLIFREKDKLFTIEDTPEEVSLFDYDAWVPPKFYITNEDQYDRLVRQYFSFFHLWVTNIA